MLGVLCTRPKHWILSSFFHASAAAHHHARLINASSSLHFSHLGADGTLRRHHSTACNLDGYCGGAASIWHGIMPSSGVAGFNRSLLSAVTLHHEMKGEGSWNVAWDVRPARWLHRIDSAWLLFGVCSCLAPPLWVEANPEAPPCPDGGDLKATGCDEQDWPSPHYRVTGVPADGRCLFRAIAHGACLISGEEAPDENHQRELADKLRAQVVDELLKRREEVQWFIEGDFDSYVREIQQPYKWGGEPELLMASHVLKTPISVFMRNKSSGDLVNIANYGGEYRKEKETSINVLFHGYGHYDILETLLEQHCIKMNS